MLWILFSLAVLPAIVKIHCKCMHMLSFLDIIGQEHVANTNLIFPTNLPGILTMLSKDPVLD